MRLITERATAAAEDLCTTLRVRERLRVPAGLAAGTFEAGALRTAATDFAAPAVDATAAAFLRACFATFFAAFASFRAFLSSALASFTRCLASSAR